MKKNEVVIGGRYLAKVSGKVVPVRITGQSPYGGWDAVNVQTNRAVRIRGAQRLRRPADAATRQAIAGEETDMSKSKKQVVLGHVYSVAVGGSYLPVRADKSSGHGRYEGTVFQPDGKQKTVKFSTDRVRGDGQPEDQWRKQQEAGKQERETHALQTAAKVASKVLGVPVGVVPPKAKAAKTTGEPKPRKKAERKDGTMSGLDAAAKILADAGEPLNSKTIVERMLEKGLWQTKGRTPASTIYAAMTREIAAKGDAARFRKADRGMFMLKA